MTKTSPWTAHVALVALFLAGASGASCSSPAPENGTNTNWQCGADADCVKKSALSYCEHSTCTDGACAFAPGLAPADASTRDVCVAARTWLSCDSNGGATELCLSEDASHCPGNDPGANCRNACKPSEYVAACGGVGPGPVPDPPAGCRAVGAVPAGVAFYCCPCNPSAPDAGPAAGKTDSGVIDLLPPRCHEPVVPGPCEAAIPRYSYDGASRSCQSFVYGGCQGNGNNFETKGECEANCGLATGVVCEHCGSDPGVCPVTTDCAACPSLNGLGTAEGTACTEPGLRCSHDTSACTCSLADGSAVWRCMIRLL